MSKIKIKNLPNTHILKPNILRRNLCKKQDFYYLNVTIISGY